MIHYTEDDRDRDDREFSDQWLRDLHPPPREPTWPELIIGSIIGAAWIVFVVGGWLGLWGGG